MEQILVVIATPLREKLLVWQLCVLVLLAIGES
jgi:hypothetical protein